jgi:probable phosphoglycerate mutase
VSRPILYVVRHGETDWNREGRLQGQRDISLNELGRAQAAEAACRLQALVARPEALDYVASPMERTRETMELLRGALGLDPAGYRTDPRLVELTFGEWEGRTWREVRKADPDRASARERDKWGYVPPGGESYAGLAARTRPFLEEVARDTVVVAHGGVARVFLAIACGVSNRHAASLDIWQGRALVIRPSRFEWA